MRGLEGSAPRWAIGLSALAIVAVCLSGSLSHDGESALEELYAPAQVAVAPQQVAYPAPQMVQQPVYQQAPMGYVMQPQPVQPSMLQQQPMQANYVQPGQQLVQAAAPQMVQQTVQTVAADTNKDSAAQPKARRSAKAHDDAEKTVSNKPQGKNLREKQIRRELSNVRNLQRKVLRSRNHQKLLHTQEMNAPSELDRERDELHAFAKTQKWWHKLAETERSPDARFRTMLRSLGEQSGQAKRQLFRRILRMWHGLRDKSTHMRWRLDHARSALTKLESSPKEIDQLKAKYKAKLRVATRALKKHDEAAHVAAAAAEAKIVELTKKAGEDVKEAKAAAEAHDDEILDEILNHKDQKDQEEMEMVEGPVSDARDEVAEAKVQMLEAKAAEKEQEAEQQAMHEKLMIRAAAADMSTERATTPIAPVEVPEEDEEAVVAPVEDDMTETGSDMVVATAAAPSAADAAKAEAKTGAAKMKAKGAAKAAAKVAEQSAKAKVESEKRKTKVAAAEAQGKARAHAIKIDAKMKAQAAAEKAEALQVSNAAAKAKAKVKAKAAAKTSALKAQVLKRKAKIKAKLEKATFKLQAKQAKAKAKLDAVKAKADVKLKLKLAEAAARAKSADEKKTKNDLEMKQAKLKLQQATANEVARKKVRSAKEKASKAKRAAELDATLKKRSQKEKEKKKAMKDKTPGAQKIKRLARRAADNARELSRKAARSTRRKDREARHELHKQEMNAQDAIKAQARQAMSVLKKRAQAAGLTGSETDSLVPEELVKLGHPAAMNAKQTQALKAAYAVGAARRAAKLAWMKVIQKMDQPSAERARVAAPNAPSVAADTAMKALVQELHSQKTAGETSLLEEPSLRLPKDKQWAKWNGTPARGASSMPSLGDKQVETPKASEEEEGSPLAFGLELPAHLTNKDAETDAQKLMHAVEKQARKKKVLVATGIESLERKVQQYEGHVAKIAGDREEREKGLQEENVKVQKANLKRARQRAVSAERRASVEKDQEVRSGEKMAHMVIAMAKKHAAIVEKEADHSVKTAHKWMKGLLEGKGHDSMWGAKLFAPRTEILSNDAYKKLQKKKKDQKAKKAKKKKAAEASLIEATKKAANAHKKAVLESKKARTNKEKKVEAAMAKVQKAKETLSAAVESSPKDQGLSRYLAVPATADSDAKPKGAK